MNDIIIVMSFVSISIQPTQPSNQDESSQVKSSQVKDHK
jgi:hypothetical protein